jgi:hypothetical protein
MDQLRQYVDRSSRLVRTCKDAELGVALTILDRTFGENKPSDVITYSQFKKDIPYRSRTISKAIKSLLERGIIGRAPEGDSFRYWLVEDNSADAVSP